MSVRFGLLCALAIGCGRLGFDAQPDVTADAAPDAMVSELSELTAMDAAANSDFGWSVAIANDLLVVGAPAANAGAVINGGAAYVFRLVEGEWVQDARLNPPDDDSGARFGHRVAIAADRVLVSAFSADSPETNAGAVHIFETDGASWVLEQTLVASDASAEDFFGSGLAAAGATTVIGSHFDDPNEQGAAYVFERPAGGLLEERTKLVGLSTAANDNFGWSVALSTDASRLVVGAPMTNASGFESRGAAYVFERDVDGNFAEVSELRTLGSHANMFFGFAVVVDGDWVAVGATQENVDAANDAGAVHFFKRSSAGTYVFAERVVASDLTIGAQFGYAIALRGERALIGAPFTQGSRGTGYLFELTEDGWQETARFVGPASLVGEGHLGESLGLGGSAADPTLVIGAHRAFEAMGRAYVR